jgi:hypothetical protein
MNPTARLGAEVAEWQTQRTQKTSHDEGSSTIQPVLAGPVNSLRFSDAQSDPLPTRFAAVSRALVEGALVTLESGNVEAAKALLLLALTRRSD